MRDIPGFEGLYAVTSCGKVWSYKRKIFLKVWDRGNGYLSVNLYKNGVEKHFLIHRLVAEAYLPNPEGLPQVNHIDEDKTHNYINNLEWCDSQYNNNYGTRCERMSKTLGKMIYCVELGRTFDSACQAARELGLNNSHISKCCTGKRKTTGGYHWRYAD